MVLEIRVRGGGVGEDLGEKDGGEGMGVQEKGKKREEKEE